jgi:hypothetical protein
LTAISRMRPVFSDRLCVSKIIDAKYAVPEQHRSGKQENSPRRA